MSATCASTFCEVEMLTTASITCSATSAIFSGPRAAAIEAGSTTIAAAIAAAVAPKRACWQPFNKPVRMKRDMDRDTDEEDIGDLCSLQDHALKGCPRPRTQGLGEGAAAIRNPIGAEKRLKFQCIPSVGLSTYRAIAS